MPFCTVPRTSMFVTAVCAHVAAADTSAMMRRSLLLLSVLLAAPWCAALELTVMMNGLPGAMGCEIAAACLRRAGVSLAPYALTGPGQPDEVSVDDGSGGSLMTVKLYPPEARDELAERVSADYGSAPAGSFVCVDFTHPTAVNDNAEWYASTGMPFVMGTTGGDRDALTACVDAAPKAYAVIAPNMAKQIVALQAALEQMASEFPNSFEGYQLSVTESHQSAKADTSGTAKAISSSLATLSGESKRFTEPFKAISRVRDPILQRSGGGYLHQGVSPVPEKGISGHAFHTYSLTSGDGNVEFQIRHNVVGRSTYAEGTVDAAVFLAGRVAAGAETRRYTMIDVLKAGEMES